MNKGELEFIKKRLEELGAPVTRVSINEDVTLLPGRYSADTIYFIPGKDNYPTEEKAREQMEEGEQLYKIDLRVKRIE